MSLIWWRYRQPVRHASAADNLPRSPSQAGPVTLVQLSSQWAFHRYYGDQDIGESLLPEQNLRHQGRTRERKQRPLAALIYYLLDCSA